MNDVKAYIQSNTADGKMSGLKELEKGYHGFSNNINVNLPYKKVTNGKKKFENVVQKYGCINQRDILIDELLKLSKSEERSVSFFQIIRYLICF